MILAGILDQLAINPELLSYEGPFGVGYAVASFTVKKRMKKEITALSTKKMKKKD
jgi:hypothetical protein